MSSVAVCRFCSVDFVTDQALRDHQKGGKCPKDKYLPYPVKDRHSVKPPPSAWGPVPPNEAKAIGKETEFENRWKGFFHAKA